MKMKKWMSAAVAAMLVLGMAGCGEKVPADEQGGNEVSLENGSATETDMFSNRDLNGS